MKWIDIPPVWLIVFLILSWGSARLGLAWTGGGALLVAGLILVAAGAVLMTLTVAAFARQKTTIVPHQDPEALVTSGILKFSRNPIYLGDVFILVGMSLVWGSWPGLVLSPLFLWILQRRFILPEEARLRAAFGAQFESYAEKVRRWV